MRNSDRTDRSELTAFQKSLDFDRIYRKGRLPQPGQDGEAANMRILSWNSERGHAPERIAETIAALQPDIACLQEVDWGNERTGGRDVLELLAEQTGMLGLFAIEFLELASPRRSTRLAGGGATGNALLTRLDPLAAFRVELPASLDWDKGVGDPTLPRSARRSLVHESRLGSRFGLGAELALGRRRLVVCSLHLEDKLGGIRGRWSQYMAAVQSIEARRTSGAVGVLAGDFNTFDSWQARWFTPDTDATALGKPKDKTESFWWRNTLLPSTGYADPFGAAAWTFAAPPFFRAKLDWITTKGSKVRSFGVGPFSTSDHRPIWVDIEVE